MALLVLILDIAMIRIQLLPQLEPTPIIQGLAQPALLMLDTPRLVPPGHIPPRTRKLARYRLDSM
jgi:hypothetical protein